MLVERSSLLASSGVGVVDTWLVIAPTGSPFIWLNVEYLERFELGHNDLVDPPRDILITCENREVVLTIEDGPQAAAELVRWASTIARGKILPEKTSKPIQVKPTIGLGTLTIVSSKHPNEMGEDPLAGRVFSLHRSTTIIGRASQNDIAIEHSSVSRRHVRFVQDENSGRYTVEDLTSSNGIWINGVQIERAVLRDGDLVDLGKIRMRFEYGAANTPDRDRFLVIGDNEVTFDEEIAQVRFGSDTFSLQEVDSLASSGEVLALPHGGYVQAALAMLVVGASDRRSQANWPGTQTSQGRIIKIVSGSAAESAGLEVDDTVTSAIVAATSDPPSISVDLGVSRQDRDLIVSISHPMQLPLWMRMVNRPVPDFSVELQDGSLLSPSVFAGRPTIIDLDLSDELDIRLERLSALSQRHTEIMFLVVHREHRLAASTKQAQNFLLAHDVQGLITPSYRVAAPMRIFFDNSAIVRIVAMGSIANEAVGARFEDLVTHYG